MPQTTIYLFRLEDKDVTGDIAIQVSEQCQGCKHFARYSPSCKAFVEGIPKRILDGKFDHTRKFPGQQNNILFTPIEEK